ncbi:unnamed protein product [Arabidopsis thaliana]|uniref:Transmembrane protein n=1 Tax=Arabidopsis thaliana TaxID=3702 RepID=A0A654FLR3_ARATH|nr:unnamed protein product [Arabidopsis thaliana]
MEETDSLRILISHVPLLIGAFLISCLHLGSTRKSIARPGSNEDSIGPELKTGLGLNPDFMEWNFKLGAPLEVIHKEEEEQSMTGVKDPTRFVMIKRFPSLSMFNPESDSELDRDFPVMSENDPTRFVRLERSIKPESDMDYDSELDNNLVIDVKDRTRFVKVEIFPSLSIFKPDSTSGSPEKLSLIEIDISS